MYRDPWDDTLQGTLSAAVEGCWYCLDNADLDEHGGIILHHEKDDKYKFISLFNINHGTTLAHVLWTAGQHEYATQIIPLFRKGWKQYASFHTHPQFIAQPSSIDLTQLFQGFKINYIYSGTEDIVREFTWNDALTEITVKDISLYEESTEN